MWPHAQKCTYIRTSLIHTQVLLLMYENKYDKKISLGKLHAYAMYKLCHEVLSEKPDFHRCFNSRPMIAFQTGRNIKTL